MLRQHIVAIFLNVTTHLNLYFVKDSYKLYACEKHIKKVYVPFIKYNK